MSRTKLVVVMSLVAFAISAVGTAAAVAAEGWEVEGVLLSGSKAIAKTAEVITPVKLEAVGVTTECKGSTIEITGGEIVAPNSMEMTSITFSSCSATENCSLEKSTISTVPTTDRVHLDGVLNVLVLVTPRTKNTLATIKYEGATCALTGTQPLTGRFDYLIHRARDRFRRHRTLFRNLPGALKLGTSEANLEGAFELELASGEEWSYA